MDIMKIGGIALIAIIGIFFLLPALSDSFGGTGGSLGGGAVGYSGESGAATGLPFGININLGELLNGSGKETSQILQPEVGTIAELGLLEGSFKRLEDDFYSGVRVLPTGEKKYVEGSLKQVGYQISPETGQKYTQVSKGLRLYTEKSRDYTGSGSGKERSQVLDQTNSTHYGTGTKKVTTNPFAPTYGTAV